MAEDWSDYLDMPQAKATEDWSSFLDMSSTAVAEPETPEFKAEYNKSHARRLAESFAGSAIDFSLDTVASMESAGWDFLNWATGSEGQPGMENPYREYLTRTNEEEAQQEGMKRQVDEATGMPTLARTVAGGVGSMVPALAAAAITGGGAVAAYGAFGLNSAGEAYENAIAGGRSGEFAVLNGAIAGAITVGVAAVGGKIAGKFGWLTAEEAAGKVGQILAKPSVNKLMEVAVGSLTEGGEEVAEFKLKALTDYITGLDPKALERPGAMENFIVGALAGMGANAAQVAFAKKPSVDNAKEADIPDGLNRTDRNEVAYAANEVAAATGVPPTETADTGLGAEPTTQVQFGTREGPENVVADPGLATVEGEESESITPEVVQPVDEERVGEEAPTEAEEVVAEEEVAEPVVAPPEGYPEGVTSRNESMEELSTAIGAKVYSSRATASEAETRQEAIDNGHVEDAVNLALQASHGGIEGINPAKQEGIAIRIGMIKNELDNLFKQGEDGDQDRATKVNRLMVDYDILNKGLRDIGTIWHEVGVGRQLDPKHSITDTLVSADMNKGGNGNLSALSEKEKQSIIDDFKKIEDADKATIRELTKRQLRTVEQAMKQPSPVADMKTLGSKLEQLLTAGCQVL